MASKGTLVFLMLFSLSCSMSIRGRGFSKHLAIEKGSKSGSTGGLQVTKSPGNLSIGGSSKEEQRTYMHYAGYTSQGPHDRQTWHGVGAQITLWKIPDVQPLSVSAAYIAAINHSPQLEIISAGFHVNPGLYKDNEVHFFTYWTNKSDYSTGCYNNDCQGFVVANGANLYPGQTFVPPFSNYGGEQRIITIQIKHDKYI